MDERSSVGGRTDSVFLDTADTGSILLCNLDVSLSSPRSTPGVLNEVVGFAVLGTGSDGEDTVVEVGSTGRAGKDSGFVGLEGQFVSLDSDGGRSLSDGGNEGGDTVACDVFVGRGLDGGVGLGALLAGSVFTLVGVDRLELSEVGLEVGEGEGHGTTIASVVSAGAINELLLGEAQKFLGGDPVSTFHSSGGGECPA